MICKKCNYPNTIVVDTVHTNDDIIKRRRECVKCGVRFNTYERSDESKERERKGQSK